MGYKMDEVKNMNTVVVEREKLLAKLKENLEKHNQIVEEAQKGYLAEVSKQLKCLSKLAKKGKVQNYHLNLTTPKDYSNQYKSAIEMLEWSKETAVSLSEDQFRKYVMDQWNWNGEFLQFNAAYSSKAGSGLSVLNNSLFGR